jgi:RNA polymerase sigma factor FliA
MKTSTRNNLVLQHGHIVKAIAIRITEQIGNSDFFHDLVQVGIIGLMSAIQHYDSTQGIPLAVYATYRIRGAMLDHLRQFDTLTRDGRRWKTRITEARDRLWRLLARRPDESEMAGELGICVTKYREIIAAVHQGDGVISLDAPLKNDEGKATPFSHTSKDLQPDAVTELGQIGSILDSAVNELPRRWQQVIRLYHFQDKTMKEVAGEMGVKEARISQIHSAATERLRLILKQRGITEDMMTLSRSVQVVRPVRAKGASA